MRKADIICLLIPKPTYAFFFPSLPAPSFYPGRTYVFGSEPSFRPTPSLRDDDFHAATDEDSTDEEDTADLPQGQLGKSRLTREAIANKVCHDVSEFQPTRLDLPTYLCRVRPGWN